MSRKYRKQANTPNLGDIQHIQLPSKRAWLEEECLWAMR